MTSTKSCFRLAALPFLFGIIGQNLAADQVWVQQVSNLRSSAYIIQAPTTVRRFLVQPQPSRVRNQSQRPRVQPAAQRSSQPAALPQLRNSILDFGAAVEGSRLPSVRNGLRISN